MAENGIVLIGTIRKKDDLEIRASLTRYRKETYIDLREYMDTEEYKGPTKKGIRFHAENWDAFFDMMKKIDREVRKRG
ncbi:transcriptional coactivator p15/PC4 family protein [bacterium]|nr:transcriptional coactivator p15/PC4 family protein [candidate division CSSED10-310 bacterium]